jgi:RNA-directed DNA polymerase
MEWMQEAYRLTRKDGVPGIDGLTAKDYDAKLEANLRDLLGRIKSGRYQAPPVRRAFIPKADGTQRPLGIPTFEDKVAQRAIAMALEAVYEQDFLACSFGFRPGRSAHQALQSLRNACMEQKLPVGARSRSAQVFRLDPARAPALRSRQTSDRRRSASDDRQMAEGGRP